MSKRWTNDEISILKNNYGKIPAIALRKLLDRSPNAILLKAQYLNLKGNIKLSNTKYYHNKLFFKNKTPNSIYWAGFIAADGCIMYNKDLKISLAEKDLEHLYKFKTDIGYTGKITKFGHYNKEYNTTYHMCRMDINGCQEVCEDLLKLYKITSAKSLTLEPPENLSDLESFIYILGYLDGNGCISWRKTQHGKDIFMSFRGTIKFLSWIKKLFDKYFPAPKISNISFDTNCGKYSIQGKRAVKIIEFYLSNIKLNCNLQRKLHKDILCPKE